MGREMVGTMSRAGLLGAIKDAIEALELEDVTVEDFTGDDRIFNAEAKFPHVAVAYFGGQFKPSEEAGAMSYRADLAFDVIVSTKDSTPLSGDGHAQAVAILESLETALHGLDLDLETAARAELGEETLEVAAAGLYQFRQTYTVRPFISR